MFNVWGKPEKSDVCADQRLMSLKKIPHKIMLWMTSNKTAAFNILTFHCGEKCTT